MSIVFGVNCKLYRNDGDYETPDWQLVPGVKDLKLPLAASEADVTTRLNAGYKASEPVMVDTGVEFEMPWDPADADLSEFEDAFFARTALEMLVLDGPLETLGSQGLRATMKVFDFSRDESLENAAMVTIKMKPCLAANAPSWYVDPGP